jgi:Ras-related protein Rab-1A
MDILRTKVALVGDQRVGKTSIINQLVKQFFNNTYLTTLGIDYNTHDIKIRNTDYIVQLHLIDCTGFSAFADLVSSQVKDANYVLYVYDSTNLETFQTIKLWKENIKTVLTNKNCVEYLIGNKIDLESKIGVDDSSIKNMSSLYKLKPYSISAVRELLFKILIS